MTDDVKEQVNDIPKENIQLIDIKSQVAIVEPKTAPYITHRVHNEQFKRLLDQLERLKHSAEHTSFDFHVFLTTIGISIPSWPAWYTCPDQPGKTVWLVIATLSAGVGVYSFIRWIAKHESLVDIIENKITPIITEMMQGEAPRK
jgi:hypothetical protein